MPRTRNLYRPNSEKPFRLSRSKVDLYLNCPRCFYLDRKLGVGRPAGFPFNLNNAVDVLLKKEFDKYRDSGKPHHYMKFNGIDAIPFKHAELNNWRNNFKGVSHHYPGSNLELHGAVDDIWISNKSGKLIVVDYKATSKEGDVSIDAEWQISYKRQIEFYQWLLRRNGFEVSDTGYFVYCNAKKDSDRFRARMNFTVRLLAYTGNDGWVDGTIRDIHTVLLGDRIPDRKDGCEHCKYIADAHSVVGEN